VNPTLALEKMAAFKIIAASLGATRIEVLSVESSSSRVSAEVDVAAAARQVGLQGYVSRDGSASRHSTLELHDPPPVAKVPKDMERWLHDPNIRSLARIMETRRSGEETTVLEFKDEVDVQAKVSKLGGSIKVGGQIKKTVSCLWRFRVRWGAATPSQGTAIVAAAQASGGFCSSCGAARAPGARFCAGCGTQLT